MSPAALTLQVAGLVLMVAAPAFADDPPKQDEPEAPAVEPAKLDAPLPEGFPDPTPPGEVAVKAYPAYRSAKAEGEGMSIDSGDFLFWPLFRHISKNEIAMTAPVINTYSDERMLTGDDARGEVSMEFLYRRPDQGKAGKDGALVVVGDHPAGSVVSLGIQGRMSEESMRHGFETLKSWLVEHEDEWKASGPPRRLGYHGPMTPEAERLWEVQIPIEPVATKPSDPGE